MCSSETYPGFPNGLKITWIECNFQTITAELKHCVNSENDTLNTNKNFIKEQASLLVLWVLSKGSNKLKFLLARTCNFSFCKYDYVHSKLYSKLIWSPK